MKAKEEQSSENLDNIYFSIKSFLQKNKIYRTRKHHTWSNFSKHTTLLIYILSCFFLPNYVAFLISIIYLSSPWCTEVILYLGHIIYSQIWFLISLIFILLAYSYQDSYLLFYCFIFFSGLTTTICFTSSSASRKFPPIIISAQFYLSLILFSEFKQMTIAMSIILIIAMFLITPYIMKHF